MKIAARALPPALLWAAMAAALCGATAWAAGAGAGAAPAPPAPSRVEARSQDLLAVGLVHGDRLVIHLSRLIDNAPVRDAAVTVLLRGVAHPATAEADGSFTVQTQDLALAGRAALEFDVQQASARETLKGSLEVGGAGAGAGGQSNDRNAARQLWWWVLNFGVCIGFLWLYTRRRRAARAKVPDA